MSPALAGGRTGACETKFGAGGEEGVGAAGGCDCGWKALASAVGHADSRRSSAGGITAAGGGCGTFAGAGEANRLLSGECDGARGAGAAGAAGAGCVDLGSRKLFTRAMRSTG